MNMGKTQTRVKTGIPGLDKLMEGGLVPNSVNLLSGGTGTGKTLFCLQFLINGAKESNEKGLYISFEESDIDLLADAEEIGLDAAGAATKVKFVYVPPYSVVDFSAFLREKIEGFNPRRVVIDSLSALTMPLEDDFERKKEIFRMRELLKEMGCTTILTSEVPNNSEAGSDAAYRFSRFGIEEFVCDSVIMLHYAGIGGEGDRAIRIVKMRRTLHLKGPVGMSITNKGLTVSAGKSRY